MESIRHLYRIGYGPSSSHTMGPRLAAEIFKNRNPEAKRFGVTLYGSLAATGKGHLTDKAITDTFPVGKISIIWKPDTFLPYHPNGMEFEAFDANHKVIDKWRVFSVGGGAIREENGKKEFKPLSDESEVSSKSPVYPLTSMQDILAYCDKTGKALWEYVVECEGESIRDFLKVIWLTMCDAIQRGLENEGLLPGNLGLQRKASSYYVKSKNINGSLKTVSCAFAYALAVAEENASGGKVVTAPTCGACGIIPAVLRCMQEVYESSEPKIINALATAGLLGNLIKFNGSISGAEVGCAGEVGAACSMAAGAAAQLMGGSPQQIEYAAEMGLEHHLGLTCDPVAGLVQIPCIERNAMAASRAMECATYAIFSDGKHRVSFDTIIETMTRTGQDISASYRETSAAGLAKSMEIKK